MNINIKDYLTKRNIIGFIIIAVLIIAIPLSVYLIRQRQILKSRASANPVVFSTGGNTGVMQDSGGNYSSTNTNVTVELRAPDNPQNW